MRRTFAVVLAFVCSAYLISPASVFSANIGTVVPIIGQVSDLVYDEQRDQVYLSNFTDNRVEIYSVGGRRVIATIATGVQPSSLALSPSRQALFVANFGSFTLTVIDLNRQEAVGEFPVGARPDAIAVGNDGQVVILGSAGLMRFDPASQQISRLPITPPPIPPAGLPGITPSPIPQGFRAGLVASADGSLMIGLSTNRLFVYEVVSGTVLRSRNVTGLSSILSVAPDGSRFMAGPFLFDTKTLTILGRTAFPAANLTGGSVFSVDGNTVYATFPSQTPINALNPFQVGGAGAGGRLPGVQPTLGVLQVLRASSLAAQLGLRLPEAVTSKIISSTDGQSLFALSTSGLMIIPIGQLSRMPILDVSTTNVVLSVDICNRTIATTEVEVRNVGSGRMTFAATVNNQNAPMVVAQRSGMAPSSVQIAFDPRRVTTLGTQQFAVVLVSPEAVNIEPAILVNLNFRNVDQRGTIIPFDGLPTDLQMDEARQRLYITNFMKDQIEVFSLAEQRFLPPIRVGSQPKSMAMAGNSRLVVANSGAENISVVDLDTLQEVDLVPMAPVPLNATPLFPRSIAASTNAILFSAVPLAAPGTAPGNGSVWQLSLSTRTAFPRLNLGGTAANVVSGRNLLVAPANGSAIVVVEAAGNGTLRLYDPISDSFLLTRTNMVPGLRGTASAAADGSFYLVDNLVFNSVLAPRGSLLTQTPGQAAIAFGVTAAGGDAVRVQAADQQAPVQRLQRVSLLSFQSQQEFRLPEPVADVNPGGGQPAPGGGAPPGGAQAQVARLWPPTQVSLLLGARGQTFVWPRDMVMDRNNNTYLLTLSGLSVVSLAPGTGRGPSFGAEGVVNAASFRGPVAPGSIITLFGSDLADTAAAEQFPLPASLGGVCVTANDVAVPLFYTSPTQINAQLPSELSPGRVTFTVRSGRLGRTSPGVQVPVNATAPGVFAIEAGGRTQAALLHADDFTPVTPSRPGRRDEDLILYATGLGAVFPVVPSGQPAPSAPLSVASQRISVFIGGHEMIVTYAGLAPGFVGLYQINIRVPGDRVQGDNLPVVVNAGPVASPIVGAPVAAIH